MDIFYQAIVAAVSSADPNVQEATTEADSFLNENAERLQPDLMEELKRASSGLDRKWEIIQEAAAEKMKQLQDQLRSTEDLEQRKASPMYLRSDSHRILYRNTYLLLSLHIDTTPLWNMQK